MLFYAGHAVEVAGQNLLIPVSVHAPRHLADLIKGAVSFDAVAAALNGKSHTTLIFLDACRNNPFSQLVATESAAPGHAMVGRTRSLGEGLASVSSTPGMLIAFATAPGQVA